MSRFLEDMQFKEQYSNAAEEILQNVKASHLETMKKKYKTKELDKDLVYVGIHSRRTDHLQFQSSMGQVPSSAGDIHKVRVSMLCLF